MIKRREFLISTCALGVVSACGGPPGPAGVTVNLTGITGLNPAEDGTDRPLTVSLLRLRSIDAFNNADFFALQSPAASLASDLVGMDQVAISAGGLITKSISFEGDALFLGIVAGFREPASKTYKASLPIKPGASVNADITVGPTGLTLS